MIRLFFRLIKWLVVIAAVLWLGQTPLRNSTVGAEFKKWAVRIWTGDFEKEVKKKVTRQFREPMEWLNQASPRITRLYPRKGVAFDESISDTDREALKTLLTEDEGKK